MTTEPAPPTSGPPLVRALPAEAYIRMTWVLRTGLVLSLAMMGGALVAYLVANPGASSSSILSANPILQYLSLSGLASGLVSGSITAYLTVGLLVLVATPIVRVASGLYYFRRAGERTMTAVTFTVLVLLLVGVLVIGPLVR